MKVFLGGTLFSSWRDQFIPMLEIDYFNPVVDDWTPECRAEEVKQREECDFCLYVITPKMVGAYSVAEVVDDSNKRPDKTILVVLPVDEGIRFTDAQGKSMQMIMEMVIVNGAIAISNLSDAADYLSYASI